METTYKTDTTGRINEFCRNNPNTRLGTQTYPGTELAAGMVMMVGWHQYATIQTVVAGRHPMGAEFVDITLDNGTSKRCWAGFNYGVLWNTVNDQLVDVR